MKVTEWKIVEKKSPPVLINWKYEGSKTLTFTLPSFEAFAQEFPKLSFEIGEEIKEFTAKEFLDKLGFEKILFST